MSKYHNKKTEIDGIKFDSLKEAGRYLELKRYMEMGVITNLQPCKNNPKKKRYLLIPAQKGRIRNEKSVSYVPDFVYEMDGDEVVEDVKGVKTDVYKLKRKLMMYIHKVEVEEV